VGSFSWAVGAGIWARGVQIKKNIIYYIKQLLKLSLGRDTIRARMSAGCPRSADKPRAPSLVVDQEMNNMEVEEESIGIK